MLFVFKFFLSNTLRSITSSSTRSFASCQEYKLVPMIRSRNRFFLLIV